MIFNASVRTKMPSSDKDMPHDQMHWLKTLIFTHLRFIKAVASDRHNYAYNIKMIKGVHQLTLRPNTLISLIGHLMDGWTAERTHARIKDFCKGKGVQARWPEYRIHTCDQYIRTCIHTYMHTYACTDRHMNVNAQADGETYMYMYSGKLKYIQININCIIMYRDNVRDIHAGAFRDIHARVII